MPYPNEHAARLLDPGLFKTCRRVNGGSKDPDATWKAPAGIDAIFCQRKDDPKAWPLQTIRLNAKKFTAAEAKKWLKDNDFDPILFEPAEKEGGSKSGVRVLGKVEYKTLSAEDAKVNAPAGENFIEGYAAGYENIDDYGDVFHKGCFAKSIAERVPTGKVKYFDRHPELGGTVVGTITKAEEDDYGLFFHADLASTRDALDAKTKVDEGHVEHNSVGFIPTQFHFERLPGRDKPVRHITEAKLLHVAAEAVPANERALITSTKTVGAYQALPLADEDTEWNEEAARASVKAWSTDADGNVNYAKYAKAFLCCEEGMADTPEGYRRQIGDVKDGKLYAIPKAIDAAAEALKNAEYEDEDEDDTELLRGHLNTYYKTRGVLPPWEEDETDKEHSDLKLLCKKVSSGEALSQEEFVRMGEHLAGLGDKLADAKVKHPRDAEAKAATAMLGVGAGKKRMLPPALKEAMAQLQEARSKRLAAMRG